MPPPPALTVVVAVGRQHLDAVPGWVRFAEEHAGGDPVEVLLVHGGLSPMPPATDTLRALACPAGTTIPRLRAAGVQAARAPIVALTEAFCRPSAGWVEALLEARGRTDALAVGGPMARAAGRAGDRALTFVEYGRFLRAVPEGPVHDLPLTNVSYHRRRLLEVLGEGALELAEPTVHPALRAAGEQLWRAPRAVMFDDQRTPLGTAFLALFHHGRYYGGERVKGGAIGTRLGHAAVSPLVPWVQLWRIAREAAAAGQAASLATCLPQVILLLVAFALGEGLGSLLGPGDSAGRWS